MKPIKYLFTSYSSLTYLLEHGTVSLDTLDESLICFGAMKVAIESDPLCPEGLLEKLTLAEEEGRISWRHERYFDPFNYWQCLLSIIHFHMGAKVHAANDWNCSKESIRAVVGYLFQKVY